MDDASSSPKLRNRSRIYTEDDVARHASPESLWVIRQGRIYDLSSFYRDHPGGEDLIFQYAGKDIGAAMEDPEEHLHTPSAYDMLAEYQIGRLGTDAGIVREDVVIDDDWHPDETDISEDYKRNQFLDLDRPLLRQVWTANFSKDFYLKQVHQPRHLSYSARLFGPWYLEMFTKTAWYVVPIFWLPIVAFLFRKSLQQQLVYEGWRTPSEALTATMACFFLGNFIWTLLEYGLHRFLFHVDEWLPDNTYALTLHFLLHGVHHALPMDRLRLVMPPVLFGSLQFPFTQLAYKLFPHWMANGIISGAFTFYVLYDTMHYALHHTKLPKYIKKMKVYHMEHHFRNFEAGYGVTSPIWDYVFGTTFDDRAPRPLKVVV